MPWGPDSGPVLGGARDPDFWVFIPKSVLAHGCRLRELEWGVSESRRHCNYGFYSSLSCGERLRDWREDLIQRRGLKRASLFSYRLRFWF